MAKPIIFLDLEGTLIDVPRIIDSPIPRSMWQSLAAMLGQECLLEEQKSHARWLEGSIPNYIEWMDQTVRLFIQHGLVRRHVEQLSATVRPTAGIIQFADRMHRHGAVMAIVTGALKSIADPVQIMMRAQHLFAGCELLFDDGGRVIHWNLLPSDWYGKVDFMNLLIREYHTNREQCVFVGDGANDVALAKQVGFSIAFNADKPLQRVATLKIGRPSENRDFLELAEPIEEFWRRGRIEK
jgi:phosphoserine phosphatase